VAVHLSFVDGLFNVGLIARYLFHPSYPWRCRFHGSQSVSWFTTLPYGSSEENIYPYTPQKWFQQEPERCEAQVSKPS
jgi:hypothetical protein